MNSTSPASLTQLVDQIHLPTIAFELATRRILAVNDRAVRTFGWSPEVLKKMAVEDLWRPEDVAAAYVALALVTAGSVESYRAVRHLQAIDEEHAEVTIRIRRVRIGGDDVGLLSFEVDQRPGDEVPTMTAITVALAITDHEWIIEQISSDIESILGDPPYSFIGTPLLSWLKPSEVARFVSTVGRIVAQGGGGTVQTVLRSRSGSLQPSWMLVVPLGQHSPPRLGVVLTGCPTVGAELTYEIDRHLSRGGEIVADIGESNLRLVSASLSTRQLEILAELLQGRRVKEIADRLFLSQSTVRNHLTDIFKKVGVHSQSELLVKFIPPLGVTPEGGFA